VTDIDLIRKQRILLSDPLFPLNTTMSDQEIAQFFPVIEVDCIDCVPKTMRKLLGETYSGSVLSFSAVATLGYLTAAISSLAFCITEIEKKNKRVMCAVERRAIFRAKAHCQNARAFMMGQQESAAQGECAEALFCISPMLLVLGDLAPLTMFSPKSTPAPEPKPAPEK